MTLLTALPPYLVAILVVGFCAAVFVGVLFGTKSWKTAIFAVSLAAVAAGGWVYRDALIERGVQECRAEVIRETVVVEGAAREIVVDHTREDQDRIAAQSGEIDQLKAEIERLKSGQASMTPLSKACQACMIRRD